MRPGLREAIDVTGRRFGHHDYLVDRANWIDFDWCSSAMCHHSPWKTNEVIPLAGIVDIRDIR